MISTSPTTTSVAKLQTHVSDLSDKLNKASDNLATERRLATDLEKEREATLVDLTKVTKEHEAKKKELPSLQRKYHKLREKMADRARW
jgi:chromosome segregation ATPase